MRRLAAAIALAVSVTTIAAAPAMAATHQVAPTKKITMAQVKKHGTAKSCWSAINGNVYDLTTWINRHPGGAARIISICGKNGSAAFDNSHGANSREARVLGQFKIGTLA